MGRRSMEVRVLGVWLLFLLLQCRTGQARPLERDEDGSSESSLSSIGMLLLSVAFLLCGVLLVALCAGGLRECWPARYLFGGRREVPASFSNPIANSSGGLISEMDVRALELDPIIFEPLPTLTDLTPRSVDHFPLNMSMGRPGAIVPFTSDESSLYAHDWFDEPFRNFPRGNLEYMRVLGKGWFGKIIEAEARDIVPYAGKIRVLVKMLREDASGLEQMRFLDESRLYRDADNGNVLKLLGHSIEMTPFLLIMEYCPQGDLKSYLIANVTRADLLNSRGDILRMALDIGKGLEWMGSADFTHGDLAARNCQVGSEGRILIGDYGIGTQLFKDDYYWSGNIAIPLRWAAPETVHCTINTIQTLKVSKLSNVWTFGVVLWELCEFGKLPYFHLSDDEVISRVLSERTTTLPQPTMPSLLLRQELYAIMTSCWNHDPTQRPSISTIVTLLTSFLADSRFQQNKNKDLGMDKDQFESKWDQLGNGGPMGGAIKSPPTSNEAGKKKSVSFQELKQTSAEFGNLNRDTQPKEAMTALGAFAAESNKRVVFPDQEPGIWPKPVGLAENGVQTSPSSTSSFSKTQINFENRSEADAFPSLDLWKSADPDEELWNTRLERGDISRKVREKSQSVQDLMILTHVEPGDLSDPDSLGLISSSKPSSSPPGSDTPLRKASSDTALSSPTKSPPSSQPPNLSKTGSLVIPDIQLIPATPTNRTGIDIQLIPPTPKTPIQINVIQPSPVPPAEPSPLEPLNEAPAETTYTLEKGSRRPFKFIFQDDDEEVEPRRSHGARHTSTPIRSTSSPFLEDSTADPEVNGRSDHSPVFNSPAPPAFSPPISPISVQNTSGDADDDPAHLDLTQSTVIFGASDDLGLSAYQSVTSVSSEVGDLRSSPPERRQATVTKPKKQPLPNANFSLGPSTDSNESSTSPGTKNKVETGVRRKLLFQTDHDEAVCGDELNETSQVSPTRPNPEEEEFWSEQMHSLHAATGNTLALFQLGLCPDEGREKGLRSAKESFEDDIRATTEEMGSLVLFDLETQAGPSVIVKETRETLENGKPNPSGIAFGGQVKSTEQTEACLPDHESVNENQVICWPTKSLIDLEGSQAASNPNSITTDEGADEESLDSTPFVPSKWNSALNPSKPTIKSPDVVAETLAELEPQKKTGIRKSVSFERKRTHLVYQYPPPNPPSDDEEEDSKRITLNSAGPLALSLDWELQPDELEEGVSYDQEDDWEDDVLALPKTHKPLDMYRISGLSMDNLCGEGSSESVGSSRTSGGAPLVPSSRLGELRHTREGLKLDLWNKGEASMLDEDGKNSTKLDSGVGSSTNVSPFNQPN